jgi:TolA-binding protein
MVLPSLLLLLACGPFFYQAPPSIGSYPERHAAKRWPHLFTEIAPRDPALPDGKLLDESCRSLPESLAALPAGERLAAIDRLLAENRGGDYSSRRSNLLHEIRELAADPAIFDVAGDYLKWRVANFHKIPPSPPRIRPWHMDEAEFAKLRNAALEQVRAELAEIDELAQAADARLKPYWNVRRAAYHFDARDYTRAAAEFALVMEGFPDHPRGVVAALMRPRCLLEESRLLRRMNEGEDRRAEIAKLMDEAEIGLQEFIASHPKGSFTPDAHGWLGAIAFDRGAMGSAVAHQLTRLDMQPTREITRSVLRECDFIFEKLLESDEAAKTDWLSPQDHFDAKAMARHPVVARLFVQHCIDPAAHISLPMWWDDSENGGRSTIDFLKRRIFRPSHFVSRAMESLGREIAAAGGAHDATTLTLLAWIATEQGEHEQALALLVNPSAVGDSDETLYARAIVLQRLGRHAQAVQAFESLAERFPASPLLVDVPFRKAFSFHQSGRSGMAIKELLPLVEPEEKTPEAIRLRPSEQLIQWLDTLIHFAPLEELVSSFEAIGENRRHRDFLQNAIRMRALKNGNFELAEKHLSEGEAAPGNQWEWGIPGILGNPRMTHAEWETHVAPLAALHAQLAMNPPASERGRLHLEIARHWMNERGRLTLPMTFLSYYANSEEEKQDLLRRRNALQLGFSSELVHHELDRRDEATQALEHALKAAESEDPAIAAAALELANECLFRRAEFSLYQKSRAYETGATALSADLHRQLRQCFPQSPEARRAVHYNFGPAVGPWMPGDYNPQNSAGELTAAIFATERESLWDAEEQIEPFNLDPILNANPRTPLVAIRRELAKAAQDYNRARPLSNPEYQSDIIAMIDRIDDLRAAALLEGISTSDFLDYANGRHKELPPEFASLLDFRKRLQLLRDPEGVETGPRNDTIAGWREFLDTYPDSPKAEAASFRLTRLIARKYRGGSRIDAFHFPEAPIPNGYKRLVVARPDPANDPDEVLAAIGSHEERFPGGRYAEDLNLLRAGALIDAGKYSHALELLDSILSNPVQRDLHVIAALDFAGIAQRLLVPGERAVVARAMRDTPGAMMRLQRLAEGDTFLSRLQPLMPWIKNR